MDTLQSSCMAEYNNAQSSVLNSSVVAIGHWTYQLYYSKLGFICIVIIMQDESLFNKNASHLQGDSSPQKLMNVSSTMSQHVQGKYQGRRSYCFAWVSHKADGMRQELESTSTPPTETPASLSPPPFPPVSIICTLSLCCLWESFHPSWGKQIHLWAILHFISFLMNTIRMILECA